MDMKILGIGNAIVDVFCKIDEGFLKERPIKDSEISFFENLNYSNI